MLRLQDTPLLRTIHGLLAYAIWPVCILSAAKGHLFIGMVVAAFILGAQIFISCKSYQGSLDLLWTFIGGLSVLGIVADSCFQYFNIIIYQSNPFNLYLAPPWIMFLWFSFAIFYFSVASSLFKYTKSIAVLAFVGFPLSYYFGAKLGAASFPNTILAFACLGLVWGILLPLLSHLFIKYR